MSGLGLPEQPEEEQPQEEQPQEEQAPQLSKHEEKAAASGWTDQETWTANGNDADDWKSAKEFNRDGDYISKIRDLEQQSIAQEKRYADDMDRRLAGVKKIHDAQLAMLKSKRDEAVENADKAAVDEVQGQIDDLNKATAPAPAVTHNPEIDTLNAWNTSNPWVTASTPKAAFAKSEFVKFNTGGMNVADSIREMERSIKHEFPDAPAVNERRNMQNRSESPRRTTSKTPKKLSMSDATADEKKIRFAFADGKEGDEAFLQAVLDSRVSS